MEDLHKISVRISVLDASQGVALLAVDAPGRSKGNTHPKSQGFVEVLVAFKLHFFPVYFLLISVIKCQYYSYREREGMNE